jgi:signal transduction histidine kinase
VKTDVRSLVQNTLEFINGQAQPTNVKIIAECPDGLPAVAVDPDEMRNVFVNLINNAFSAMPGGGTLRIRCRYDRDIASKEVVAVEFIDTGVGIPESQLDKVFDPFFTTRLEGEGTGLGLSISYMIVQNHGGRIEVESKVGEGSTFRVYLTV